MSGKFATAINCMDGRAQMPVIEHIKRKYGVNYVDMITEPGPNKILSENKDKNSIDSIKRRVAISVEVHKSGLIAIVGHHDCAGNPADKEGQRQHILSAITTAESWGVNAQIIGLWVDENWNVHQV